VPANNASYPAYATLSWKAFSNDSSLRNFFVDWSDQAERI